MPSGEAFSDKQQAAIERARAEVRERAGLHVSVYVGALGAQPRARAEQLLAGLGAAGADVALVAVDPAARRLELVTGARAARRLDERSATLAALAMTSSFGSGDLAGGIVNGIRMLGEHASALSR
ncbi:DUF5130 family protein [Motilibacter rhizosphaerae]|uniref:DUF5130 family protein n=1 Tax=Motilibacter rhizosphaerae TaxID=598652 RepID=UPI00102D0C01|nr:DUF5130 family protein [Motilibacter rhizosphaerae]